jgi:hypothetical protein
MWGEFGERTAECLGGRRHDPGCNLGRCLEAWQQESCSVKLPKTFGGKKQLMPLYNDRNFVPSSSFRTPF